MSGPTYLKRFRDYLTTRTDAPVDFHLHAGLCTLAVAMGNHVWCDGPARNIYPNIHTVVLAPSGMGKSVPLDMASIILSKAELGGLILPSSFSREGILVQLGKPGGSTGIFILQEFAAFMSLLNRDYNHGSMEDLTDLYDGSDLVRKLTKAENSVTVTKPALTLLGASSPDWFASAFSAKNLRGGYLARFLFCPSKAAGEPIGDPGPRSDEQEAVLAGHLQNLQMLSGRMDMSACRQRYDDYAKAARLRARSADPDIAGMRSRGPLMARKVAMLFHVSREISMAVSDADMEQAIKFVEYTHDQAERYLLDEVARDKLDADRLRIMEIIRGAGGRVQWSYALKRSKQDSRHFEANVRTLVDGADLVIEAAPKGERGRWLVLSESSPIPVNSRGTLGNSGNGKVIAMGERW